MELPDFIRGLPGLEVPFSDDVVEIHALRSDRGLVVFFHFKQDFTLPEHSHKAQWGTVLAGEGVLTIGGVTRAFLPGESYDIPSGVLHGGKLKAGTRVIDVFEEPDRYPLRQGVRKS